MPSAGLVIRLLVIAASLVVVIYSAYSIAIRKKSSFANIQLCICAVAFIFLALEAVFMFVAVPHGIGYTRASQLWYKKYWKPINSFGFRDQEPEGAGACHTRVLIIGDSIVAGAGIKNPRHRFSNLLKEALPESFCVSNVAKKGADTLEELEFLRSFPYRPDVLVLGYCMNDIIDRAKQNGIIFNGFTPYVGLIPALRFLVRNSYFLDFLYWEFPHKEFDDHFRYLGACYADGPTRKAHFDDLRFFIDYSRENRIPLFFLVFPVFGKHISLGPEVLKSVDEFFSLSQDVEVVNVSDLVTGIPERKLSVNKRDPHPNELVNRLVADALLKRFKARGIIH